VLFRSILGKGNSAPYTFGCLEKDSIAMIHDRQIVVPSGLYEHHGIETLADFNVLVTLWKTQKELLAKVDGKQVVPIVDDGHCLFASIGHKTKDGIQELRASAAKRLRKHPDYAPDQKDITKYASDLEKMEKNIVWGGESEIRALSEVLRRTIYVHQEGQATLSYGLNFGNPQTDVHVLFNRVNHYDALE